MAFYPSIAGEAVVGETIVGMIRQPQAKTSRYPTIHGFDGNDLDTQGYGALPDAISCAVTEELNGGYTLELKYPLKGIHCEHLTVGNIIMVKPNHNQTRQAFRINQVKKSLTNSITVYANHISYDLSGYPMQNAQTFNSLADVINALNSASWSTGTAAYNQFTFDTDITSNKVFTTATAQTVKSWMGAMLETYGGEWEYDNFGCHLKARRGEDTGLRISYGKNLAEYLKQMDYSNYSHVCAVWKKSDITVMSSLVATGASCAFRCAYIDATKDIEAQPTVAQLDTYAAEQIATLNLAEQTITVTPVQIGNVIGMGDSVLICYETVIETRVVKTVWDAIGNRYTKLELGTIKPNIADTIKSISSSNDSIKVKAKQYSGTLNSYGCIQTDLKPETVVISAKTVTGTSFQCTPLVAGGWWWIRAVDWTTGNKGSGSITVTVNYF